MDNGLLYFTDRHLLCVLDATLNRRRVAEIILDLGRNVLGHMGHVRTAVVLVANNGRRCAGVLQKLRNLPDDEAIIAALARAVAHTADPHG
jgi:hypothetical protein